MYGLQLASGPSHSKCSEMMSSNKVLFPKMHNAMVSYSSGIKNDLSLAAGCSQEGALTGRYWVLVSNISWPIIYISPNMFFLLPRILQERLCPRGDLFLSRPGMLSHLINHSPMAEIFVSLQTGLPIRINA